MAPDDALAFGDEQGVVVEAQVGHVVLDAHGEVVLGLGRRELVEDGLHHGRRELLGGQAVAAADHLGEGEGEGALREALAEGREDVLVQRLARGARLLGAVEDGDGLDRLRDGAEEGLHGEGPEEPDLDEAHLLAARHEVLDGFVGRLGARAHDDDDALGVGGADVVEEVVLPADDLGELVHGLLDDGREGRVERVAALAGLEEDVGVLGRAAQDGVVGREGPRPVGAHEVVVDHGPHVVVGELLDLLDLVRGCGSRRRSGGRGPGPRGWRPGR